MPAMIAAFAAVAGVVVSVWINGQSQEAQRLTQRQADFTTATQQLAAADNFTQAAGITTLATLVKNYPDDYRETVCQVIPFYITQAAAADRAHAPKTPVTLNHAFAYRPGILLAVQRISPNCPGWRGLQLSRADLARADLTGVNLIGANLSGANLDNANLIGANLTSVNLIDTILVGTDLTGANLTAAHLTGANLAGANLTGAKLGNIWYDETVMWPKGFVPPPSR